MALFRYISLGIRDFQEATGTLHSARHGSADHGIIVRESSLKMGENGYFSGEDEGMNTYSAIIEQDGEWFFGYCPDVPGANGQGRTIEECKQNLAEAIELIIKDLRDDYTRGIPEGAIRATITA